MSVETDLLLDRRRLKRRLSFWRAAAVLAVVAAGLIAFARIGGIERAHVARLAVNGLITQDRALNRRVRALASDDDVKALLLEVNSPGGSVAGGESLHDAVAAVAANKPVVVVMGGLAASAAYMISAPATRIYALPATLTGSIGVLLETGEVSGLLQKLGISTTTLVSGPLKDQPAMTHPLSADGRAYTGKQALALGLVDALGDEEDARDWLAQARGISRRLPVEDVETESLAARTLGASFGPLLQGAAKAISGQGVSLDGAWSIWQPAVVGQ